MRALYRHFTPEDDRMIDEEEKWGITGLLHDMDYELAQKTNQLDKHGILLFKDGEVELPDDIAYAIMAHNYHNTRVMPRSDMDWAIASGDQLTGLIVAAALVLPEKKLQNLTVESILKRFKEKSFARGADRNEILNCESKLDIPLEEFVGITLKAMQSIHTDLEL